MASEITEGDVAQLREEVAYWRRDLSARIWFLTAEYEFAVVKKQWDRASDIAVRLSPALASYDAMRAQEWHQRCEACGEYVLPGEPSVGDEVSGHVRCLLEGHQDTKRLADTTEQDLDHRAAKARKALDKPWPSDEGNQAAFEDPRVCYMCDAAISEDEEFHTHPLEGDIHARCCSGEENS